MAIFKCKMCGGALEITEGLTTCECSYCGTSQTLPKLNNDKKANLYDRADHFRRNNDFDKAMNIYEQILNEDTTDAEAYWSLVLCKYGIEYVDDPATHKKVPTVNRAQYTSIYSDGNYKAALQYADSMQKNLYEAEASVIDDIQRGILEISNKEEPFDVFICYKETDNNGRRTQDSVLANDLYHQLTQEGFKVFFSRITLEDKLGSAYEPYIFAALNSSKVMVVLGTKPEFFNAVWVRNEWSRYLAIVKQSEGKKMLIPAYRDMDPYDLPEEFSHLQAQDMSKLGFMQDLIRGIKKILDADKPQSVLVEPVVIQQNMNSNVVALIKRGNMALEDGEWEKADGFFEEVLNQDAECAEAYLGKVLAKEKKQNFDEYINYKCNKYADSSYETLEACKEDESSINKVLNDYRINGYLDKKQLEPLFQFNRMYSSNLSNRKDQLLTITDELENDKLLARVRQNMSGDLALRVNEGIAKIYDTYNERIESSQNDDAIAILQIQEDYKEHISNALSNAESLYNKACEKRMEDYQSYIAAMKDGRDEMFYFRLKNSFLNLGDFKEAAIYAEKCQNNIERIEEERRLNIEKNVLEEENRRSKKIIIEFVVIVVIGIVLSILYLLN